MTFMELARARFSERRFANKEVEQEKLDKIIEAGIVAPSARNLQPVRIYVAKSEESRAGLAALTPYTFDAPVILLVCYDKDEVWQNPFEGDYTSGEIDASIMLTHMMMEATELGLGTCWVGYFSREQVAREMKMPESLVPIAMMPLGYPREDSHPAHLHTKRKTAEEIVEYI